MYVVRFEVFAVVCIQIQSSGLWCSVVLYVYKRLRGTCCLILQSDCDMNGNGLQGMFQYIVPFGVHMGFCPLVPSCRPLLQCACVTYTICIIFTLTLKMETECSSEMSVSDIRILIVTAHKNIYLKVCVVYYDVMQT